MRTPSLHEVLSFVGLFVLTGLAVQPSLWDTLLANERPIPGSVIVIGGETVFVRDPSIDKPLLPETVPMWYVMMVMGFTPLIMAITEAVLILESSSEKSQHLVPIAAWLRATALTEVLTASSKTYMGVLRPNFYAGCGWDDAMRACTVSRHRNGEIEFRKSFPSGHSAHSACVAVLLTLHLLRHAELWTQIGTLRSGLSVRARVCQIFAFVAPPIALFVAASRVHDNWHHPADVIAGLCLGTACAALVHRVQWPTPYVVVPRESSDPQAYRAL